MSDRRLVEFVGSAVTDTPEEVKGVVREELPVVFPNAHAITVSRCFKGYAPVSGEKIVLGVGVREEGGFATHIVKLGTRKRVEPDYLGWQACIQGRDFASRIFVPVRPKGLKGGRFAVVYRDAYTFFNAGPADDSGSQSLEKVVGWAVHNDDRLDPLSAERAIAHLYIDLSRWFYNDARPDLGAAAAFYTRRLGDALEGWSRATAAPHRHRAAHERQELRRDAIWLFCGQDRSIPEGDALYLDAVEYVAWALATRGFPLTWVGRAHGDLHARNVLVGVQRGEVEYPAVFDYGSMSTGNVLAWDFAKLETELKVRLLPELIQEPSVQEVLDKASRDMKRAVPEPRPLSDPLSETAARAARLERLYQVENTLGKLTDRIQSRSLAEAAGPPGGRGVTGHQKLDRLVAILLRIRQEAALALGFCRPPQAPGHWRDEYYFAVAVYGLCNAKEGWSYEPPAVECALVSSGVAVANLQAAREEIRRQIEQPPAKAALYPSYRVPLAIAYGEWKAQRHGRARGILEPLLSELEHALPLKRDLTLLRLEEGDHEWATAELKLLREHSSLFGDHETLCRIGRGFKSRGDRLWGASKPIIAAKDLRRYPAGQMYLHAFEAYHEAFKLRKHYYPGVNAATLALILGMQPKAIEIAAEVEDRCRQTSKGLEGEEAYWVYSSEGEAALVRGDRGAAKEYFRAALSLLRAEQVQMAQSTYFQLCRLWHVLGPRSVEPIVRLFERHRELWRRIKPGPLGDCGGRARKASGVRS
jgi:hypothetical protein